MGAPERLLTIFTGCSSDRGEHVISYRTIDNKTDPQWNESGVDPSVVSIPLFHV